MRKKMALVVLALLIGATFLFVPSTGWTWSGHHYRHHYRHHGHHGHYSYPRYRAHRHHYRHYDRHDYINEKHAALVAWEARLEEIKTGKKLDKIVRMRTKINTGT